MYRSFRVRAFGGKTSTLTRWSRVYSLSLLRITLRFIPPTMNDVLQIFLQPHAEKFPHQVGQVHEPSALE